MVKVVDFQASSSRIPDREVNHDRTDLRLGKLPVVAAVPKHIVGKISKPSLRNGERSGIIHGFTVLLLRWGGHGVCRTFKMSHGRLGRWLGRLVSPLGFRK